MATRQRSCPPAAACLEFHQSGKGGAFGTCLISPHEELDVGREVVQDILGVRDQTISTHHLRFRCVLYEDDDQGQHIPPMVYVRVLSSNSVVLTRQETGQPRDCITLSRRHPDTLLMDSDSLQLTTNVSIQYFDSDEAEEPSDQLDEILQPEIKRFANKFLLMPRKLGAGGYASVFVAVKQSTKRQVACKIVPLPYKRPGAVRGLGQAESKQLERKLLEKRENLAREYNVLKDLNHPNIITLEKVFCTTYNLYIFQELITGGDLLSYLDQKGPLSEPHAAVLVYQILKGVGYLHDHQIAHRDLKPENILMTSWRDGARIVLTDFGQARTTDNTQSDTKGSAVFRMQSIVGTHGYVAPEVFRQANQGNGYSKAIDIWSVGCITATLLTNDTIYGDDHPQAQADKPSMLDKWDLSVIDKSTAWMTIGRKAKSFVRGCLVLNEDLRLTVQQALLHQWLTNRHYAAELQSAYKRAIADWRPRKKADSLIEYLDTSDTVATDSKPQNFERLEKEQGIASRHFQLQEQQTANNMSISDSVDLPPPEDYDTPLSAIGQDSDSPMSKCAESKLSTRNGLCASPLYIPESPTQSHPAMNKNMTYFSIQEYAPPADTQPSRAVRPYFLQSGCYDSVTQSQSMLDGCSPPKDRP